MQASQSAMLSSTYTKDGHSYEKLADTEKYTYSATHNTFSEVLEESQKACVADYRYVDPDGTSKIHHVEKYHEESLENGVYTSKDREVTFDLEVKELKFVRIDTTTYPIANVSVVNGSTGTFTKLFSFDISNPNERKIAWSILSNLEKLFYSSESISSETISIHQRYASLLGQQVAEKVNKQTSESIKSGLQDLFQKEQFDSMSKPSNAQAAGI
jgi:hypothetical protein